jgi:hypothetical protein
VSTILVFGISRRSGTNFIAGLLECHADCAAPGAPIREDHLLRDADLLVEYARRATGRWPARWGDRDPARRDLELHLGSALVDFLADRVPDCRVVSRTPSCDNLALLPRLIPNAAVIVLLRDGRSASESLFAGFGWSFRKAVREWRRGARAIMAARPAIDEDPRFHVIRYEDLIGDLDRELVELLTSLGLDAKRFDWTAARNFPVIGSSFVRTDVGGLTWQPVDRPADFNPTARHERWRASRHARFDWLAGREQRALGYESATSSRARILWAPYNVVADLCAPLVAVRDWLYGVRYRVRVRRRRLRAEADATA